MKAVLALLIVLGLASCVSAGGYGNYGGYSYNSYYQPAAYKQYGYVKPYPVVYGGGDISGGSGAIIPIIIISKLYIITISK